MNEKKILRTYQKLSAEFYDLEHHVRHEQSLNFYIKEAQLANGPILEPMCGTGRFLIPMLQLGLDVQGFDASSYMLDVLALKYGQTSTKKPPVWQEFVQDFVSNKLYRLIFIPYGSWGLITDLSQAKKSLENLYNALDTGGKLLIEIETVASVPQLCGVWQRGAHKKFDGSTIALNFITSYQPQSQLFKSFSRYELIVNNNLEQQEEELFEQYLYKIDEFDQFLSDVGFGHIKKYPAFDREQEVSRETPIIIYECVKEE